MVGHHRGILRENGEKTRVRYHRGIFEGKWGNWWGITEVFLRENGRENGGGKWRGKMKGKWVKNPGGKTAAK